VPDAEEARRLLQRQALDYRQRAEQFRTVGENTRSAAARRALLDLAVAADKMATEIEQSIKALQAP
jgi:hypothetical protein